MQNPLNIQELGNWIWEMIQKVFAFFQKPLGGIMMVLVAVIAAAIYGDRKSQSGYEQGMKNQKTADSIYTKQLEETNKELKSDKRDLQARIDTLRKCNCEEETQKAIAYVESITRRIQNKNEPKSERLEILTKENKSIRKDIKEIQKIIPKTQKQ